MPAALFTSTSMEPHFSLVSANSASTVSGWVISSLWNQAVPPASAMASTTAAPRSSLRPQTTTRAPSAPNIFAMPVPMPLVEPVTMATLSFKRSMVSLFLRNMASQHR